MSSSSSSEAMHTVTVVQPQLMVPFFNIVTPISNYYNIDRFGSGFKSDLKGMALVAYVNSLYAPDTVLHLVIGDITNHCINTMEDPVTTVEERGLTYCFNKRDKEIAEKYERNPYTGRTYAVDNPRYSDIATICSEQLSRGRQPYIDADTDRLYLAPQKYHSQFLNYVGKNSPGHIDLEQSEELSNTKSCEPLKLYRGMRFNFAAIELEPLVEGKEFASVYRFLSSWSTDINIATNYSKYQSKFPIAMVVETIASPSDIIYNSAFGRGLQEFKEVRLRPGIYDVKVVYLQDKDKEATAAAVAAAVPV